MDNSSILLHHESLKVPPPLKLDKTTLKNLDTLYNDLDDQMTVQLNTLKSQIDSIEETFTTTTDEILIYFSFGLSLLNSLFLAVFFYLACKLYKTVQTTPFTSRHGADECTISNCPKCGTNKTPVSEETRNQ